MVVNESGSGPDRRELELYIERVEAELGKREGRLVELDRRIAELAGRNEAVPRHLSDGAVIGAAAALAKAARRRAEELKREREELLDDVRRARERLETARIELAALGEES